MLDQFVAKACRYMRWKLALFALVMLSISAPSGPISRSLAIAAFVGQTVSQTPDGGAAPTANPASHKVTLTWKASVPASKAPGDAIIGYIVYRSTQSHDPHPLPINPSRVTGTTYVDANVEAGKTYYYVTRAVSANGKLSAPSNETEAKIPPGNSH